MVMDSLSTGAATVYTNTRSCPPGFPKHASNPGPFDAKSCICVYSLYLDNGHDRGCTFLAVYSTSSPRCECILIKQIVRDHHAAQAIRHECFKGVEDASQLANQ